MNSMSIVLAALALTACKPSSSAPKANKPLPTTNSIQLTIGNSTFNATLAPTVAAQAFASMLPLTLTMNEMNGNEKYASLPKNLHSSASHSGSILVGDIMLFGSNTLVLFYESFRSPYAYTKIGQVDNPSALQSALGTTDATVKFKLR